MIKKRHLQAGNGHLILVVITVLIMAGVVGYVWWHNTIGERAEMESYLEQKYGKKFEVTEIRTEGAGIGMPGTPVAKANLVGDDSLQFKVWDKGGRSFSDEYLRILWSAQAKKLLGEFVDNNLPDVDSYSFEVLPDYDLVNTNYPSTKTVIGFKDTLNKYPEQLASNISIKSSRAASHDEPSGSELERAFIFIQFVKQLGITTGNVSYIYTDPSYTETNKYGDAIYRYQISIDASELKDIESREQLNTYFQDRIK